MEATARLVKKHGAVIIDNADAGMKAFTRGEVVIAPFWNGRASASAGAKASRCDYRLSEGHHPGRERVCDPQGHSVPRAGAASYINEPSTVNSELGMTERFNYPPSNRTTKLPRKYAGITLSLKQHGEHDAARLDEDQPAPARSTSTAGTRRCWRSSSDGRGSSSSSTDWSSGTRRR